MFSLGVSLVSMDHCSLWHVSYWEKIEVKGTRKSSRAYKVLGCKWVCENVQRNVNNLFVQCFVFLCW